MNKKLFKLFICLLVLATYNLFCVIEYSVDNNEYRETKNVALIITAYQKNGSFAATEQFNGQLKQAGYRAAEALFHDLQGRYKKQQHSKKNYPMKTVKNPYGAMNR